MINTLEELLQDYVRYSFMEGTIDENTCMHLVEDAQIYIKRLSNDNLLSISGNVGQSEQFYCANKDWCGITKGRHCYKAKCEEWSGKQ